MPHRIYSRVNEAREFFEIAKDFRNPKHSAVRPDRSPSIICSMSPSGSRDSTTSAIWKTILGCVAIGFALCGCASVEPLPLPSAEVRNQLGNVAIASEPFGQPFETNTPVSGTGRGALNGAGQGALGGIGVGALGGPYGVVLGIFLAPATAIIGGAVGATKAHSEADVKSADAELRAVFEAARPNKELRAQILAAAMRNAPQHVTGISNFDHTSDDARSSYTADEFSELTPSASSYPLLADAGYNSVLEIEIISFHVQSEGHIDPDIGLELIVEARLVLLDTKTQIFRRRWVYQSELENFFVLAADHAKRLHLEFESAYSKMAEKVVHDLFVADQPEKVPLDRWGSVPGGNVAPCHCENGVF